MRARTHSKRIRWLVYTVLVGLIPILSRCFVWRVTRAGTVDVVVAADFIAFGLVLHIATINQIEHVSAVAPSWKTAQNGLAVSFVSLYSVLYSTGLVGDKIVDKGALIYCATILALISFLLNYSVFYFLDPIAQEES